MIYSRHEATCGSIVHPDTDGDVEWLKGDPPLFRKVWDGSSLQQLLKNVLVPRLSTMETE